MRRNHPRSAPYADHGFGRTPTSVYAPQFRELEKLENSHQVSSWIHELDRSRTEPLAIREVKEDSDAVLSARSSDDEIVDITTLKEQIASTRADLHTSVRKANKIGILRTRSPKLLHRQTCQP
jgi:hypothetical protein